MTLEMRGLSCFINCWFPVTINGIAHCLKITEKVLFNIPSEASYVYILSEKKFIKILKNGEFGDFLKT